MMAASKPTSYLSKAKHFLHTLSIDLGTLSCDLGSFPRVHEALPSRTHCHTLRRGIRSLFGRPTQKGTANQSVLYPLYYYMALPLKAFRGEPAITRLDKLFTPNHTSSDDVALSTGSGLHFPFGKLHPGHG
jgi:hypothetical protein